jgi:hypothetical protein
MTTAGLMQIGRTDSMIKIYMITFLISSFFMGLELIGGVKGYWHSSFIKEVFQFVSASFVVIAWFLALVGGGLTLFEKKQTEELLKKYRYALRESADALKAFEKGRISSKDIKEYSSELYERTRTLEACIEGSSHASAKLQTDGY